MSESECEYSRSEGQLAIVTYTGWPTFIVRVPYQGRMAVFVSHSTHVFI